MPAGPIAAAVWPSSVRRRAAAVERIEDRAGLLGGQPALGQQAEDPFERLVRHRPAPRPGRASSPTWIDPVPRATGRRERLAAVERLEPATGFGDVDVAALERAQDAESRVLVGGGDRAVPGAARISGSGAAGPRAGPSRRVVPVARAGSRRRHAVEDGNGRTMSRSPDIVRTVTWGPAVPMTIERWPRPPYDRGRRARSGGRRTSSPSRSGRRRPARSGRRR